MCCYVLSYNLTHMYTHKLIPQSTRWNVSRIIEFISQIHRGKILQKKTFGKRTLDGD